MESQEVLQQISFDYKDILIDEVSLEGLEGITLEMLWRRIEFRTKLVLTAKSKSRFWQCLTFNEDIEFFELINPRLPFEPIDRFSVIYEPTGQFMDPREPLDGPYEYAPIPNEYGSCKTYNERKKLKSENVQKLSLEEAVEKYGHKLVLVASLRERWRALAPNLCPSLVKSLRDIQYCFLELVGKARENGQTTVGTSNLSKLGKDPKLLFYFRKTLTKLGFLKTNSLTTLIAGKGVKTILITLIRFHKPPVMCVPNRGPFLNVYNHLKSKPNLSEATDALYKEKLMTPQLYKRWKKIWNILNVDVVVESRPKEELKSKTIKKTVKRQYYSLKTDWSDSSDDEEETVRSNLQPQPVVGVPLYRQAYERLLEAGGEGLKILELAKLLNIDYYAARPILSLFVKRKIAFEKTDDKGKVRTSRYIAYTTVNVSPVCLEYSDIKGKLLKAIEECKEKIKTAQHSLETEETPAKKIKLIEDENINKIQVIAVDTSGTKKFTEVLQAKKQLSVRILRYANELLKELKENVCLNGYQATCRIIAEKLNDTVLDTKPFKELVYKLANDEVLRIYELVWTTRDPKTTYLICSMEIDPTHSIIRAKQREIALRVHLQENNKLNAIKKEKKNEENIKPIVKNPDTNDAVEPKTKAFHTFARYLKLKKLHEFIYQFVYGDEHKELLAELPDGIGSIVHLLPELKIEFVIGLLTNSVASKLDTSYDYEILYNEKLKNAPPGLFSFKTLQAHITELLRLLSCFGLVQICESKKNANDIHSGILKYNFFVNRNAKLLNTRGEWPRLCDDVKSLEMNFYFNSLEDVTNYWDTLFDISTKTRVVGRSPAYIHRSLPKTPVRSIEEVNKYDIGEVFGNGRGAAGFDSSFYIDQHKFWVRSHEIFHKYSYKKPAVKKKAPPKKPTAKAIIKKPKCVPSIKASKKTKITKPLTRKRVNEKDLVWEKWEDDTILLCRVAMTILSPSPQPGTLTVRNLATKELINLRNSLKTTSQCHKRAMFIESHSSVFRHERDCLLNEFKKHDNLVAKYEGLLKDIKQANMHVQKQYLNTAKMACFEIIYLLLQIRKTPSYTKKTPCVASNINEFNNKYMITPLSTNAYPNYYKYDNDDVSTSIMKEALIMAAVCRKETPEHCTKIYNIFKDHDENLLRLCLEHLKKSNSIAAKSKLVAHHINSVYNVEPKQMTGIYRLSRTYEKRCSYYGKFLDNIIDVMKDSIPDNIQAAPDINTVLLESQTRNKLEVVSLKAPGILVDSMPFIDEHVCDKDIMSNFQYNVGVAGYKKTSDWNLIVDTFDPIDLSTFEEDMLRSIFANKPDGIIDSSDPIVQYLSEQKEKGATYEEVKKIVWQGDDKTLQEKLRELEKDNVIKRCGYYENRLVAFEHLESWTFPIDGQLLLPAPWLSVYLKLDINLFALWTGVLLNYIVEYPGKSITDLSDTCENLSARHVQDICMFLLKYNCIKMKVVKYPTLGLFSDDSDVVESDFNEYEQPNDIRTFPVKDSLTRYAYVKSLLMLNVVTSDTTVK